MEFIGVFKLSGGGLEFVSCDECQDYIVELERVDWDFKCRCFFECVDCKGGFTETKEGNAEFIVDFFQRSFRTFLVVFIDEVLVDSHFFLVVSFLVTLLA